MQPARGFQINTPEAREYSYHTTIQNVQHLYPYRRNPKLTSMVYKVIFSLLSNFKFSLLNFWTKLIKFQPHDHISSSIWNIFFHPLPSPQTSFYIDNSNPSFTGRSTLSAALLCILRDPQHFLGLLLFSASMVFYHLCLSFDIRHFF